MFDPMVVPLDGSALSEAVLPYVEQIARAFAAHVRLVHVMAPDDFLGDLVLDDPQQKARFDELVEDGRREAVKYLKRQQVESLRGIDSEVMVLQSSEGGPAEAITEYSEERGAGLIAMTTHGRGGFDRWAMGSVADRLLHMTRIPLLLIRASEDVAQAGPIRSVLVPLDGSELAEGALPLATALAQAMHPTIRLFRAVPPFSATYANIPYYEYMARAEAEARLTASSYLSDVTKRFALEESSSSVEMGDPARLVIQQAAKEPGTLIAMTTHGRSGLGRWLLGSVADTVVRSGAGPVLLIRARR